MALTFDTDETNEAHERPIIFSGEMVRAILEGRKTQTRRVVKLPHRNPLGTWAPSTWGGPGTYYAQDLSRPVPEEVCLWHTRTGDTLCCPHGQPGDLLWVRESYMPVPLSACPDADGSSKWDIVYRADGRHVEQLLAPAGYNPMLYNYERWTPSIHMPRWASRITLRITDVRVQRLQEITEADAIAEGVSAEPRCMPDDDTTAFSRIGKVRGDSFVVARYAALWESLHGPGSWDENPWVWALTFETIRENVDRVEKPC